jgi:23S rRNA (guanosine2251-2'-O)-methyltransferase
MGERVKAGERTIEGELIYGVHPVMETLEKRPQAVAKIWIAREDDRRLGRLLKLARGLNVPVQRLPRAALSKRLPRGVNHQGVAALVAAAQYAPLEEMTRRALRSEGILLLIDGVQDAGNLGAMLRTAAAAGVEGVVLATDGTVGLTAGAVRASAGAAERVEVARTAKPSRWLRESSEMGFRTVALDARGGEFWDAAALDGALILVAGGEEKGLRPGVRDACSQKVAIALSSGVESLNVAVASGVLLFEARRRRRSP